MSVGDVQQATATLTTEDMMCPVCFLINQEPVNFGKCLHTICISCAARWLETNTSCPMCRGVVEEIFIDEELKKKVAEYLCIHPEQDLPHDAKYMNTIHEIVFWVSQQRKSASDADMIFCGKKPQLPDTMSEQAKKECLLRMREENIWKRIEVIKARLDGQMNAYIQTLQTEDGNVLSEAPQNSREDENHEWRVVAGRGLLRVPRSTHRNHCPLRFRRSHST